MRGEEAAATRKPGCNNTNTRLSFVKVRQCHFKSALKGLEIPDKPFIHDVKLQCRNGNCKLVRY
jgi:hypothetical protein